MPEHGPTTQTPESVPPPRQPVPDLGFFAGAPSTGGGAGFGGAPRPSGGIGQPVAGSTMSTFGSAPSVLGAPPPPIGAPPPFRTPVAAPFGAPPPLLPAGPVTTAPRGWTAGRIARRVGIPVGVTLVLGILGMGVFGGLAGLLAGDLELPATLQGLAESSEAGAVQAATEMEAELERRNSGDAVAGAYGAVPSILFVAGQRTRVSIEREMADAGVSATTELGDNTCGTTADGLQVCLRTSRGTSIMVLGSLPVSQVSDAVTEVWDAQ